MTILIAVVNHQEFPHWTTAKLFANLTFTPFILDEEAEIGVAWTLFIEFQLYIAFGIVFRIARWFHSYDRSKVLFWILLITSLLSFFVPDYTIGNVWFHPYWKWFSLGSIVSISVNENLYRPLPTFLCLFMMSLLLQSGFQSYEIPQSLLLIAVAILALTRPSAKVWQQGHSLRNLAKISYAWFLTHILVVRHSHYIQVVLTKLRIPVPVTYFVVVSLSLLLAIAITPLMNRIDKFLMAKLFPRKATSGS
jgi:peptidoglycan/LPS O-acetylase OafA/YrhL